MLATPELIREAAQWPRVAALLPRWRRVPLYRARLPADGEMPAGAEFRGRFARVPFLSKRELREGFPGNFLPPPALESLSERGAVELEHTSGTAEERTPLLLPRGWWEAQEARALRPNARVAQVLDEHPGARRATLTTPVCNGHSCPAVWQSRAQRTFGDTLFLNLARIPFVLGDAELTRMADELAEWAPQFLDADPVHAVWFALHCERLGLRFPSLRFVLCSYEFLSVVHRRILERVFGVPVFNLYGSTETGHLLMEDKAGQLRAACENAVLEVLDADERHAGELVVTTLTNELMPLVRYRIGDLVERRELPYATDWVVHGRAGDALRRSNGGRATTWDVDQCFAQTTGIAHYEFRQQPDGECRLRFVPDANAGGVGPDQLKALSSRLETLLESQHRITAQSAALLPPEYSGKFRLTGRI